MIRLGGKVRDLLQSSRYFLRLPLVGIKLIFTTGWDGFWTKFKSWLHRFVSGQLRCELILQQSTRLPSHRTVYRTEKAGYIQEIKEILANNCLARRVDRKDSLDVVVPIYNAYDELLVCLHSVLRHQDIYRVLLLDDCSTDGRVKELLRTLREHEQEGFRIEENSQNLGYLKTANKGMRMAENDVILLNTDTVVTSGWARRMRVCAYSDDRIATVTPFTNNGRMCSIPEFLENNEIPEGFTVDSFAECVENCSRNRYPELATAVGFCMYVRRSIIDEIGYFDEVTFEKGYGEEVDFSFKAKGRGYKNVLCDNTFVFHKGRASFLEAQDALLEKNNRLVAEKYPDLWTALALFERSNPLKDLHDGLKAEMRAWNVRRLARRDLITKAPAEEFILRKSQ